MTHEEFAHAVHEELLGAMAFIVALRANGTPQCGDLAAEYGAKLWRIRTLIEDLEGEPGEYAVHRAGLHRVYLRGV